jgi:protein subunit release factor A
MSRIFIEINAGEGGSDAKLLVNDQLRIYVKAAIRSSL